MPFPKSLLLRSVTYTLRSRRLLTDGIATSAMPARRDDSVVIVTILTETVMSSVTEIHHHDPSAVSHQYCTCPTHSAGQGSTASAICKGGTGAVVVMMAAKAWELPHPLQVNFARFTTPAKVTAHQTPETVRLAWKKSNTSHENGMVCEAARLKQDRHIFHVVKLLNRYK